MRNQKAGGAILAYFNILLSMLSNILLVPIMIGFLSDADYSIYKVMQSFAGPLVMFNLGISTIASRCVAKYRASDRTDPTKKENTLALSMIVGVAMALLILVLGFVMRQAIPGVFGSNYSVSQIQTAQKVFLVLVANTAIHVLTDVFTGCIQGNARYLFSNALRTVQHILHFFLIVLMLNLGFGAVAVTVIDFSISLFILAASVLYSKLVLKERFCLTRIDREELLQIASFSAAILLQAIVNQVNNSIDNVILGATVSDKAIITMYSSALSIYTIYNTILTVLAGMYLPEVTQLVIKHPSGEELTDLVIKVGRIQAVLAVAILCAFTLAGRDFICLWIGEAYSSAYEVILMLIIPVTIPLVQNLCITILDANLKRFFRSAVLVVMAVLNFVVSVFLVRHIGFWGAALGTALSLIIGNGVLMNLYYHHALKLNILRMFREIFSGILPSGILALLLCLPFSAFDKVDFISFLAKCLAFVILYIAFLWKFGLLQQEKKVISSFLPKKRDSGL